MSDPVTPARARAAPAIRGAAGFMVRYSGSPICHTEFGIRKSEIGIREFAFCLRKHWSGCGSENSSWCGIFPLDADGYGAVGCAHRRMVRWCNNEQL